MTHGGPRTAEIRLGHRDTAGGDARGQSAERRLLRHVTGLADLEDDAAIERATLAAALDLVPCRSAMLARPDADGRLQPRCATGPLAERLGDLHQAALETLAAQAADGTSWEERHATAGSPGDGVGALVAVGLSARGVLRGVLVLADVPPGGFCAGDAQLLELLAAHAGASLRAAEELEALRRRAATDPLTGLGHHASFHAALANSHRRPRTAVLLCDIDGFKGFNDSFGHQQGDRVLRATAGALGGALRRGDRLFRIGGDEFAALLLVSHDQEALDAGERLRAAVENAGLGVTVSVGVAVPRAGETDAALFARADQALYRVKASGRDGVALAGDEQPARELPVVT